VEAASAIFYDSVGFTQLEVKQVEADFLNSYYIASK
jgi:hypothetical protein